MKLLTTYEAARIMDVSHQHVRRLAIKGLISARKIGRDWVIPEGVAKKFQRHPTMGRPRLR